MGDFKKLLIERNREKYKHLLEPIEDKRKASKKRYADKKRLESLPDKIAIKKSKRDYQTLVRRLTKEVKKEDIKGYNKGLIYNQRRDGIMVTAYDKLVIDHKIPVVYGYKNNIDPIKMADVTNLQYLTVRENMLKGMSPLIDDSNKWILE